MDNRNRPKWAVILRATKFTLAIALFGFICWIIFLANTSRSSVFFRFSNSIPFGDKISHAGLYGTLAFLANCALDFRYLRWRWLMIGSLAVLVFALGEELTQYFNPSRTLDWKDATADVAGVAIATLISTALRGLLAPRRIKMNG